MVICRFPFSECEKKIFDKDRQIFLCKCDPCYTEKPMIKKSEYDYLNKQNQRILVL